MSTEKVTIPVVCVVLEGGPNTLETVKSAVENGTPAIIVGVSVPPSSDIFVNDNNNQNDNEWPLVHDNKND